MLNVCRTTSLCLSYFTFQGFLGRVGRVTKWVMQGHLTARSLGHKTFSAYVLESSEQGYILSNCSFVN